MFGRAHHRSRRDREPSVRRNIAWGVLCCVVLGLFLFGLWYVTRLPSVTLSAVIVEGGETIEHRTIEATAENVLAGDYLKLIPHRFFMTYPHEDLLTSLRDIDRVKDVEVTRDGRNKLHVAFTEYEPYALWCATEDPETDCFFLDQNGFAFAKSPKLHGNTFVRHVKEGESELGKRQVIEKKRMHDMHAFLRTLEESLKLRVTDILYTTEGDITLYVNGGGKIYLRSDGAYDKALENLETILRSEAFDHLEPGNFNYIDIRFGNKIFVNEQLEPIVVATTTEEIATTTPE